MDCNKTEIYAQELKRMCMSYHACQGCPLQHEKNCLMAICIDRAHINVVQEWSDTHPETVTITNETVTYVNSDLPSDSKEWTTTTKTGLIQYSPLNLEPLK